MSPLADRPPGPEPSWTPAELAARIDHTLLAPGATSEDVERLCEEAREHRLHSVCVNGAHVERCSRRLGGSGVAVCAVIGFPLGAMAARVKAAEARAALEDGAGELDVVLAIGALRSGDLERVREDLAGVIAAARERGALVKVILETGCLSREELERGCRVCEQVGADLVKSCTGFGPRGVSLEDVELMRRAVGTRLGIKAAGGVRTAAFARQLLDAGATRLGCSASLAILREAAAGARS